jgi:hypothetical protein
MTRASERLFFHAGPIIIVASFYLLFHGYRPLWAGYFGTNNWLVGNGLAFLTVVAIYGLARYFERLFAASLESRSWITSFLAGFIGIALLALSSLGVSNALYYAMAGRHVIENGVKKLTTHYDLLSAETRSLTTTPVLADLHKRIDAPLGTLLSEIVSPNCGIGTGALRAIGIIRGVLGPTFTPLNFNRTPRCDDKPGLAQMAEQYRIYIERQLLAVPSVIGEQGGAKTALLDLVSRRHDDFRKQAADIIVATNDAARMAQFFGSRDSFSAPVRSLIALNEKMAIDQATAVERAAQFGGKYSAAVTEPIDMEQEKALGNFWSLYLAMVNLNPWYVIGFVLIAVLLDILLVAWFHFTRTRVFANRVVVLVGDAGDRVRYLWTPPVTQRRGS